MILVAMTRPAGALACECSKWMTTPEVSKELGNWIRQLACFGAKINPLRVSYPLVCMTKATLRAGASMTK